MRTLWILPVVFIAACGGESPTAPTPPPPSPPQNRAPVIGTAAVTPTFGVADLQVFSLSASATDADNDALTYTWDVEGSTATGSSRTFTVPSPGGTYDVRLTVTDGKGGTASQLLTVTAGSLSGTWTGTFAGFPLRIVMQQERSGLVTASWTVPGTAIAGGLDPAVANTIDAAAHVRLRCKVTQGAGVDDFVLAGTLQPDGRTLVGTVTGSGFSGQPFTLGKN